MSVCAEYRVPRTARESGPEKRESRNDRTRHWRLGLTSEELWCFSGVDCLGARLWVAARAGFLKCNLMFEKESAYAVVECSFD